MTDRTLATEPPETAQTPSSLPMRATPREEWGMFALAMGAILIIFGLLYNRWWVPGGDGDLYLAAARSIVQGHGFRFNGLPVNLIPPGWPLLLAGAIRISSSFAFLKLLNLSLMTVFLGIFYWVARRFVPSPRLCAGIVVGTALISHAYELSFWFHSDALFCTLTAATLLAAFQAREKSYPTWRIVLVAVLCAASVYVRWAGVFNVCIVAGILLDKEHLPRATRPWIATAGICIAVALAFFAIRASLKVTPAESKEIKESGVYVEDSARAEVQAYQLSTALRKGTKPVNEALRRTVGAGRWFSSLFWQPFRLASSFVVDTAGVAVGWFAILLFVAQIAQTWRRRQWIWLGLAGPCLVLFALWPNATARYLVPWAPLLVVAILQPLVAFASRGGAWKRVSDALVLTFVISCVLCNFTLFCVEAWVAHRPDFYGSYEAGLDQDLINVARYVVSHGAVDNEIAISPKYVNMNRIRFSRAGIRAAVLLTDRAMALAPNPILGDPALPPAQPAMNWLHQHHIHYYIFQPPISPWRVWHFRLPWLQKRITGMEVVPGASTWQLWDVRGQAPVEIKVPPVRGWPTNVPGL